MLLRLIKPVIERFPRLARIYRNIRDQFDIAAPSILTPWNFILAGHPQMASGTYEPEETQLVRELLQEVDLFVNIGANLGYYCLHALSFEKPVIAVEPMARNVQYLMRNIEENGWARKAEIFPVALGAHPDILHIWGGGTGASLIKGWAGIPDSYVTQVPVLTLDRLLGKTLEHRRSLILVDVEGAEFPLLQGAVDTLRCTANPIWLVEISSTDHQPQGFRINPNLVATFEMFFDHGYNAFTADIKHKPVLLEDVKAVAEGRANFSVHNFIFRK